MKAMLRLLPLALTALTGCQVANQMNAQINASTEAIHANREAVECDTVTIRRNAQAIRESNQTLIENLDHIEKMSKS